MRTKLSAILLSLPLALAACSHSHGPSSSNTVPAAPEFGPAGGPTVVDAPAMSASASQKPILPDDQIFFANDSTALNDDGHKLLAEVATWVMAEPGRHVVLEGHTDSTGSKDYNLDLAARRSLAAADYLKTSLKVPADRIVITAMGEQDAHLAPGGVNRRILIFATDDRSSSLN